LTVSIGANRSDTITMSDNFSALITLVKDLVDTINLSDAESKGVGLNKADTIVLSDTAIKNLGLAKSDSITMSDFFSAVIPTGAAGYIFGIDSYTSKKFLINGSTVGNVTKGINLFDLEFVFKVAGIDAISGDFIHF